MAASQWMTEGVSVTVRTSRSEYNAVAWEVVEPPQDERVKLVGQVQNMEKVIRVGVGNVWPASLALCDGLQTLEALDRQTLNLQLDVPFHWRMEAWVFSTLHIVPGVDLGPDEDGPDLDRYLETWMPVPGFGGNSILLRRSLAMCPRLPTRRRRPLVMYPRLEQLGLEMWFRSNWYGQSAEIIEFDVLKPCPAGQIWPFCSWCRKFHLPYDGSGSHRCSREHLKARAWLDSCNVKEIRARCEFYNVQGRWL